MRLAPRPTGLFMVGLVALLATRTVPPRATDDPRVARLEEYLDASARLGRINGAVLVAERGRVLIDTAYGFANQELGAPNTPATRFRVASVTKQFTAMAIMMLVEDGKLTVQDPISRWLDSLPPSWSAITVDQLLHHTSGISDYEGWFDGYTTQSYSDYMAQADAPARIARDARTRPLDFTPGTRFHYNNTGYVLLGYIIAHASGMSYQDFVRTRILEPLGMSESLMDHSDELVARRAQGYRLRDGAYPIAYYNGVTWQDRQHAHYQLMTPPQGEAGLVTTTHDLYRWDQALYTDRLVRPSTLDAIFTPGLGDYGDGWFIRRGPDGVTHEHSGGLPGFTCYIMRIPDTHRTIIVLQNIQRLGPLVRDLAAIMRGDSVPVPVARHLVRSDATRDAGWVGTYRIQGGDSLVVTMNGATLTASWNNHFRTPLYAEASGDYFAANAGTGTARFRTTTAGTELSITDAAGRAVVTGRRGTP
jgi:CubicO group peptidase (beta-lactamase class C family)